MALMMALMVLGMPPVYSCHVPTGRGLPSGSDMSELRVCPPIESEAGIGISAMKEELDAKQWVRLPAVHCVAMQSSLPLPCGVQPRACWEALRSGRLKVGEAEYPMTMNHTRSHMANQERCAGSCGTPVVALERKIIQVLMEVLVEEDWIWWNEEKNRVATKSGKMTSVLRKGEAILEDGLRVWNPGDDDPILAKVGGANLPIDGGGTGSINRN